MPSPHQLLRPAKIANALRRRRFEAALGRGGLDPGPPLIHLGTDYGGWHVPDDGRIGSDWICWCVGAGGDVSFDRALRERFDATVRTFEPVKPYCQQTRGEAAGDPGHTAHRCAIAAADGTLRMAAAADPAHSALSAADLQRTDRWVGVPARSLSSLATELGDERIDLLKLDLEGIEYDVLPALDLDALGVRVLGIELHHTGSVRAARELLHRLRAQGFAVVHRKAPTNYLLVR